MRWVVLLGVASMLLAACGSGGEQRASDPVSACVERFVAAVDPADLGASSPNEVREYLRRQYCDRFADEGWVYPDGALSIAAQRFVVAGMACAGGNTEAPAETMPCGDYPSGASPGTIACGVLRHVRRAEVDAYLADLGVPADVRCDDGTSRADVGVP